MGSPTLLLLASLATVFVVSTAAPDKIVCYYTNWSFYRPGEGKYGPEDIDPTLCTQIVYSFAILDDRTGTMVSHDRNLDIDKGFYKKIIALKQKNSKLKVLIAIGGWNDSQGTKYSKMVSTKESRANFVTNAVKFLKEHQFDGLDLDWEYPAPGDKKNFGLFCKELKEAFEPHKFLLTAAVAGAKWKIEEAYDVPVIGKYLDQINIMAYDLKGVWDGKTGHHAAIYSADGLSDDGAVEAFIKLGAPKEKLILGMPLYGRSWTLANPSNNGIGATSAGTGQAGKYTREGGVLAYYEICGAGWTRVTDPSGKMGPYAYNGRQWTSYDDEAILKKKCEYVKSKGLGGAMIWDLSQDDFNDKFCDAGRYPLLNAINVGMGLGGDPNRTTRKPQPTTTGAPTTGGGGGGKGGVCTEDGELLPNPKDCTSFFKCAGGIPHEIPCPAGLHYSEACTCCNWPALSECRV